MIFNRLEEKRTFLRHLNKRTLIFSFLILFSLTTWSILIQTSLRPPDESIIYQPLEVIPIEFSADLTYIEEYSKTSKADKIERIFTKFDIVINPNGDRIFLKVDKIQN